MVPQESQHARDILEGVEKNGGPRCSDYCAPTEIAILALSFPSGGKRSSLTILSEHSSGLKSQGRGYAPRVTYRIAPPVVIVNNRIGALMNNPQETANTPSHRSATVARVPAEDGKDPARRSPRQWIARRSLRVQGRAVDRTGVHKPVTAQLNDFVSSACLLAPPRVMVFAQTGTAAARTRVSIYDGTDAKDPGGH